MSRRRCAQATPRIGEGRRWLRRHGRFYLRRLLGSHLRTSIGAPPLAPLACVLGTSVVACGRAWFGRTGVWLSASASCLVRRLGHLLFTDSRGLLIAASDDLRPAVPSPSCVVLLVLAAGCLLLLPSHAVAQKIWNVAPDVIYVPLDGLALDAHTGHVRWRYPRFLGNVFTDGNGGLVVAHLSSINRKLHLSESSLCRVRTNDGKHMWCHRVSHIKSGVIGGAGKFFFLLRRDRVEIYDMANGKRVATVRLNAALSSADVVGLPDAGAALFSDVGNRTELWFLRPPSPLITQMHFPERLYAFRGASTGLLLYDPARQLFLFPPLFKAGYRRAASAAEPFPRAVLNARGYVFTDWVAGQPVITGGRYDAPPWKSEPLQAEPHLLLFDTTVIAAEPASVPGRIHMSVFDLSSGKLRFRRDIPGPFSAIETDGRDIALTDNSNIWLIDATTGAEHWRRQWPNARPGAISTAGVVIWQGSTIITLDRRSGAQLWRVLLHAQPAVVARNAPKRRMVAGHVVRTSDREPSKTPVVAQHSLKVVGTFRPRLVDAIITIDGKATDRVRLKRVQQICGCRPYRPRFR